MREKKTIEYEKIAVRRCETKRPENCNHENGALLVAMKASHGYRRLLTRQHALMVIWIGMAEIVKLDTNTHNPLATIFIRVFGGGQKVHTYELIWLNEDLKAKLTVS